MKSWFQQAGCSSRAHCVACRSDRNWRQAKFDLGEAPEPNFECPHGITAETAPKIQEEALATYRKAERKPDDRVEKGRAAWAWLHAEGDAGRLTEDRLTKEFTPMIPRYGCACLNAWNLILAATPCRPHDQSSWACEVHNAVNLKLGKPLWPYKPKS